MQLCSFPQKNKSFAIFISPNAIFSTKELVLIGIIKSLYTSSFNTPNYVTLESIIILILCKYFFTPIVDPLLTNVFLYLLHFLCDGHFVDQRSQSAFFPKIVFVQDYNISQKNVCSFLENFQTVAGFTFACRCFLTSCS